MPLQLFLRAPGGLRAVQGGADDTVASLCGLELAAALDGGVLVRGRARACRRRSPPPPSPVLRRPLRHL